ncbi:MAG: hypothetical protein JSV34_03655 [Candidatus Omnitrophota bacterium]|nr:MAG: hypothetical protein JSV34_03655 [Candidatus Omnitrophota bacterium]
MGDKPLIISLLVGLIVVLVIAGVSLLVRVKSLNDIYKKELSTNMSFQKTIESLKEEISSLKEENGSLKNDNGNLKKDIVQLNFQIEGLNGEMAKLEKLKDKLEENLKDELMKRELKEK